jgi:hypothetical protein
MTLPQSIPPARLDFEYETGCPTDFAILAQQARKRFPSVFNMKQGFKMI